MSLVEMLAALAIGALLASLGVTVYSTQTEQARQSEAEREISQIQLAISAFATNPGHNGGLPPSLAALGLEASVLEDPWGRPYEYVSLRLEGGAAAARVDGNDLPLNRDYDLYSYGPDGLTAQSIAAPAAGDDIVRAATGSFVGTGSEFSAIGGAAMAAVASGSGPADGSNSSGGLDPRR